MTYCSQPLETAGETGQSPTGRTAELGAHTGANRKSGKARPDRNHTITQELVGHLFGAVGVSVGSNVVDWAPFSLKPKLVRADLAKHLPHRGKREQRKCTKTAISGIRL